MTTPPPPITAPSTASASEAPVALHFLRGVAMGTADVIPGVSGGTVALILGIYARLIVAIRSLASAAAALVRGRPGAAGAHWRAVPWRFVLPLGIGIVTALGVGSVVLPPLLESYPSQTSAVFFGMILASLAVPWRDAGEPGGAGIAAVGGSRIALAAAFAVLAFLLTGLPEAAEASDPASWQIFASAAVAICAMILPGVSGAYLLLVLGLYEPTLEALRTLDLAYVATFVLGAVVGLGSFSKLLGHLLEHRLGVTMAALTGLMLGALRRLWPWGGLDGELHAPPGPLDALVVVALMAVGFLAIRVLLHLGDRAGHPHEVEEAVGVLEDPAPPTA